MKIILLLLMCCCVTNAGSYLKYQSTKNDTGHSVSKHAIDTALIYGDTTVLHLLLTNGFFTESLYTKHVDELNAIEWSWIAEGQQLPDNLCKAIRLMAQFKPKQKSN